MKKVLFLSVVAVAMSACSNDVDLGLKDANKQSADNAIGFQVLNKNMSRATLQEKGHYNFGVFGYKYVNSGTLTGAPTIMENYLVGYQNGTDKKGYKFNSSDQTTLGDASSVLKDKSMWAYEKLGYNEYSLESNAADEHYYLKTEKYYMSNWANQFLRYWDKSTDGTKFYAYAPYYQNDADFISNKTSHVYFDNDTKILHFPNGSLVAGYNDQTKYDYLYAATDVANNKYGEDVALNFKHLSSRIRIVFYENIAGYDVKMLDLHPNAGIIAVPTTKSGDTYSYANNTLAMTAKLDINFSTLSSPAFNYPSADTYYAASSTVIDANIKNKALVFAAPTADKLLEDRTTAVNNHTPNNYYSADTYYGIPHAESCGLTFRVSFQLTSTTGEIIKVYNTGVHVEKQYCKWEAGKSYTYVFKITKKATGDTGTNSPTVDPNPGTDALYPIVFDGITIDEWQDVYNPSDSGDHNIN